jgi:hypothetical protein
VYFSARGVLAEIRDRGVKAYTFCHCCCPSDYVSVD